MIEAVLHAHLMRLLVAGGLSVIVGLILRKSPFGMMTAAWGAVNILIALASLRGDPPGSGFRPFLAFNLGLDLGYVGVGIAMATLAGGRVRVRGFGQAVVVPGAGSAPAGRDFVAPNRLRPSYNAVVETCPEGLRLPPSSVRTAVAAGDPRGVVVVDVDVDDLTEAARIALWLRLKGHRPVLTRWWGPAIDLLGVPVVGIVAECPDDMERIALRFPGALRVALLDGGGEAPEADFVFHRPFRLDRLL